MKNSYKILLLSILFSASTLSSCGDEFLDETPSTEINAAEALLTENDVLSALRGAYGGLASTDLYGLNLPVLGDMLADNLYVATSNSGYFNTLSGYNFLNNSAEITEIWTGAYDVINRTNSIINSTPTVVNQEVVDQYKGEAYALRALIYFELVRHFARPYNETADASHLGVPIVVTPYEYNAQPKRNTVAEVYTQILADLDKAYTLMTMDPGPVRMSKYAARALQAEVNLYKGDNTAALQQAEEVINDSGVELLPYASVLDYWEETDATKLQGVESLFEVSATQTENNGVNEYAYFFNQGGYGQNLATPSLFAQYSADDIRRQLITVGRRGANDNPAYIVTKYNAISGDAEDKVVIRMSEVYLIAAEAAYRTGNSGLALTYLNTLVNEREPGKVYASTGTQLLSDIISERRKELAFEGDRFATLNRLKLDITGRRRNPNTLAYSDPKRILPIPRTEITANPNIQQNPNWD
ncbi:RagB/SusD family nutrient uptake outer membrane protein [Rufibacter sediminis]|uniref:RagB/SusD family nutrient uptake outer membrane protein n=1 Tax=Rufibacter sediminis TaxID=2762756 RepID=A0ABR6VT61_9BACT|nr:RagB/SusD family nutrient uptake outer membrane protein [Rufibacter sediminis]MBC3540340.1 RagB/SusD family nutrient uptake outer membrane protein [Rufibacter sediminis]